MIRESITYECTSCGRADDVRRTRQVVAYFIGDRGEKSCWRLWHWISAQYRHCRTFSDFWETYQTVFGTLAPAHQAVGKETGETAHVERWNNTLRQRLARFVRKTLSGCVGYSRHCKSR